jgi:BA14K-like protein
MTRLGVLGATALSLSFAIATPVLAQQQAHGGRAGMSAHSGGNMGGARMSGGPRVQSNMGTRANVGGGNFAARGNQQFTRSNPQFAQRGEFRRDGGRGFQRDAGFAVGAAAAGIATGAAIAAGGYDPYYGDNYAYDSGYYGDSYAYDTGIPLVTFDQAAPVEGPVAVGGDASYCAQRYRSWDPASGTYLGFDGLRHPCP